MESVGKNGEGQQIILQSFTGGGVMVGKEIENARGSEDRFVWPEKKIKKTDMKGALKKKQQIQRK